MKTLVTGGAGFIGSQMIFELLDRNLPVCTLDNFSTGTRGIVPPQVPILEADIADQYRVAAFLAEQKVDTIIHFAAFSKVPESFEMPDAYFENNVSKFRDLLMVAMDNGVENIVFSSSASVYGNQSGEPIKETLQPEPWSPYAKSKLEAEQLLIEVAEHSSLNYAILRYFNVAGADPNLRTGQVGKESSHLIKVATEAALGVRPTMPVYGEDYDTPDGTCIRDYIHVKDLAAAHVLAVDYLRENKRSFIANCGYGVGYSVKQVIQTVEAINSKSLNIEKMPRRPGDAAALIADPSRLMQITGWQPQHDSIETIIRNALDWEKKLRKADASKLQ